MSDVYEHNLGDHEDPLTGPTWIVGLAGAVLLVVIVFGLTALFYNAVHEQDQEQVILRRQADLQHLRHSQMQELHGSPRFVERREGEQVVQSLVIPIDRAMELVVAEHSHQAGGGSGGGGSR